jgi:hypothetical protein
MSRPENRKVVIYRVWPAYAQFPQAQKKKNGGAEKHPFPKKWAHRVSCPFLSLILCTLQLSPLYHHEEDIKKGSRNMYFCIV